MGEAEVALIVVTHDSEEWLGGFFESWLAAVKANPVRYEVVVADSGSAVSPEGRCQELCPEARVILCGNVGYGAAVNRGVAETKAPWIIFCNPDITFASDFSEKFCNLFQNENETTKGKLGVMSPIILNPDGSRQLSIGKFPTIGSIIADQFRERSKRKYNALQPVPLWPISWATGACLMVRRDTFNAVHGFDEKFFLYVEEVDFQKRLRNARFINFFCPPFTVTHHAAYAEREESAKVRKYSARGLLRYFAKHGTWGQLLWFRVLGVVSGRLGVEEAFASKAKILERATGP
jgi:N-acetylglucosaminyl-diphospho-decaprenol L-rhamnosyltransferase